MQAVDWGDTRFHRFYHNHGRRQILGRWYYLAEVTLRQHGHALVNVNLCCPALGEYRSQHQYGVVWPDRARTLEISSLLSMSAPLAGCGRIVPIDDPLYLSKFRGKDSKPWCSIYENHDSLKHGQPAHPHTIGSASSSTCFYHCCFSPSSLSFSHSLSVLT